MAQPRGLTVPSPFCSGSAGHARHYFALGLCDSPCEPKRWPVACLGCWRPTFNPNTAACFGQRFRNTGSLAGTGHKRCRASCTSSPSHLARASQLRGFRRFKRGHAQCFTALSGQWTRQLHQRCSGPQRLSCALVCSFDVRARLYASPCPHRRPCGQSNEGEHIAAAFGAGHETGIFSIAHSGLGRFALHPARPLTCCRRVRSGTLAGLVGLHRHGRAWHQPVSIVRRADCR